MLDLKRRKNHISRTMAHDNMFAGYNADGEIVDPFNRSLIGIKYTYLNRPQNTPDDKSENYDIFTFGNIKNVDYVGPRHALNLLLSYSVRRHLTLKR